MFVFSVYRPVSRRCHIISTIAVSFDLYQRTMMDEAIDGSGGKGI